MNDEMIANINRCVDDLRKNTHQDNPEKAFAVNYFAVLQNGDVVVSSSSDCFSNAEWGIVVAYCAIRQPDGYFSLPKILHISNSSITDHYVYLRNWKINVNWCSDGSFTIIAENRVNEHKISINDSLDSLLNRFSRILPLVEDVRSQESINNIVSLSNNYMFTTKQEIIDILFSENKSLKDRLKEK